MHHRLVWTFRTEVSAFQRKAYVNLSHEANKAMNLNSYIGLAGGAYREEMDPGGLRLVPAGTGPRDLVVPDPEYLLTLDADSVLLPEYCLRLVHLMEQKENQRVAVAQTPYSAYPGSSTRLERLAGATTDLQHISHQGMTSYDATFWVGANAVLRKRALDDIETTGEEDGFIVHRYIQDRTVIEDTESSLDLAVHGWTLHNYPERLSYSATPPDFGSLSAQRQRWAKRSDVLRIYGFNLVFLPVNLAGVLTSVGQAITGRKIAFKRTPKVRNRTTAGLWFIVLPYGLVAFSAWTLARDIGAGAWGHAVFAGSNALLAGYAILAFIGLRHSVVDVVANVVAWLRRPSRRSPSDTEAARAGERAEWEAVLHYGSSDLAAAATAHQQEVSWLRDRRRRPRLEPTMIPADVLATLENDLDNLAQGENLTVFRDRDGFRVNRSGRPIPFVRAARASTDGVLGNGPGPARAERG